MTPPPTTESLLESQLEGFFRDRVRQLGGYTIKLAPTERGVPDRLVIFPKGRMYLVELKTETGRLSPIQMHWHSRMKDRGVRVYTLYGTQQILDWLRWVFEPVARPTRQKQEPWAG